jgi:threonine/homoserine/homoserine lactone efflux protein
LWAQPGAAPLVTIAAAGYFVWLAWRIASAPPLAEANSTDRLPPTFTAGIVLSLLNPKAYASMAALFSGFVLVATNPLLDAGLKTVILVAVVFTVDLVWLSVGAVLTRHFRNPRHNRIINILFAALLILSIAATLLI